MVLMEILATAPEIAVMKTIVEEVSPLNLT